MNLTNFENRIESFLTGKMNAAEKQAFKHDLKSDKALEKLFINSALAKTPAPTTEEQKIRTLTAELKAAIGPLKEPELTWWDNLRFAYQEWAGWKKMLVYAIPALLLLTIGVGAIPQKIEPAFLVEQYIQEPYCDAVAGSDTRSKLSPDEVYNQASAVYCGFQFGAASRLQELANQSTFNMAYYFLAHQELKSHHYTAAITGLKACLANRQVLRLFKNTDQPDKLQLNLALAQFGEDKSNKTLKNSLIQLNKNPETTEKVRQEIGSLLRKIKYPYDILGLW
jgi:hypothetical protein